MKINIFKSLLKSAGMLLVPACVAMSSCSEDIDESNLYTFTGQTIEDFLVANDTAFSSFNYILTRVGYDRVLSSYGSGNGEYYTCFAPNNGAVAKYIDYLYNDTVDAKIAHNGMTENSLEGLTDSLCLDITLFHIAGTKILTTDMGTKGIRSLLGRMITTGTRASDGATVLNENAAIIGRDNEVVNGVVHVIDSVIPRSNRTVAKELDLSKSFTIFNQALKLTGLADSLTKTDDKVLTADAPAPVSEYYIPTTCKRGFTVFAETDEVLNNMGINTIDELIAKTHEWYAKAATGDQRTRTQGWYDWYRNNKFTISTGTDYTSEFNTLNMFVRYHILKAAVGKDVLAWDHNILTGHGYTGDAYDYYETMLPKTLLKTWKIKKTGKIYINRYIENNTLTDGVETLGSDGMHKLVFDGCEINTAGMIAPLDGYIYPIDRVLLYDAQVPMGVLNERIRVDALTMLPEICSNGFRGMRTNELTSINGGKSAGRIRFPVDYFDNVIVYNGNNTQIDMNVVAAPGVRDYTLYRGDSFQGMGIFDFAIKLPPVPDGVYELRINLDCMMHGTMLQYYLSENGNKMTNFQPIDIPLDMRINTEFNDPRLVEIGCVDILTDEEAKADLGLASDKIMRTHKYMRGPLSCWRETPGSNISRYTPHQLRRILDTRSFEQKDYWLRLKTVLDDGNRERKFQIDYIELVPVGVAQNDRYLEDMY